jgi:hypothetical protein
MSKEKGRPTRVIVSSRLSGMDYMELLDGASYVKAQDWSGDWEDPLKAAAEFRATNAQVTGRGIVPDLRGGNFCKDAWTKLGMRWNKDLPPQFDRMSVDRERALAERVFKTGKPKVLVMLDAISSPFGESQWLRQNIEAEFGQRAELVWLDSVKGERLYDLMGLMDRAACLVSVDTVALHLVHGTTCPVISLVNGNGFSATPPKGNCVLRIPYLESTGRWKDISDVISAAIDTTFNDRMVHVYSPYQAKGDAARRNAEAFATWPNLGARLLPFEGRRNSGHIGDPLNLPFFRDMIQGAIGDEGIIVLSNNDVKIDLTLADEIRSSCCKHGCYWAFRIPEPGGKPDGGTDLVAMTRQWWVLHRRQFPDLLFGSTYWDQISRRVMTWAGCHEQKRLYYHENHHGWFSRKDAPSILFNKKVAQQWFKDWQEDE